MPTVQTVSDSELIIMHIIWDKGGTARFVEIYSALEQRELIWNKSTALTFLSRLVKKGFLKTRKFTKNNEYSAIVKEQEYAAAQTALLVDKVYEGDVKELINTLIQRDMIPAADKDELIKLWKARDGDA